MSVAQTSYERKEPVGPRSVWFIVDVKDPFGRISGADALGDLIGELGNAVQSWKDRHQVQNGVSQRSGVADTKALHVMKTL